MPTNVSSVTNHFPEAQNGFTTTTAGAVSSGATTVSLNSVAGYTNGQPVVFVIDPTDATKKQTFTGLIDTAGTQVTSVVWTAGTNQSHALGATVVDYATATHINMVSKGLKVAHNQDGTLKNNAVTTASITDSSVTTAKINDGAVTNAKLDSNLGAGWIASSSTVSSVTANGNRSYTVVTGTDLSSVVSPGMRLRTTRTVAAPTQCTSLNGTNQYYSKTSPAGMTFTDDITLTAWIKLSTYPSTGTIVSRKDASNGWGMRIESTGQLSIIGITAGNYRLWKSYQSVPLNKWVHVAASLDMSGNTTTTNKMMIDGVDVPVFLTSNGTPSSWTNAGNLEIGSGNAGEIYGGKIAQVAIFSGNVSTVTQATIRDYISQGLAGNETSLISAYSFNNSINDLNTSNANNLTANNSAVATNADSPFGGQAGGTISSTLDYGIVQAISGTSVTVQVAEGNTIPTSGGVSAIAYSIQKTPYGLPAQRGKWRVESILKTTAAQATPTQNTWYNLGSLKLNVPIGSWANLGLEGPYGGYKATSTGLDIFSSLSTSASSESDAEFTTWLVIEGASGTMSARGTTRRDKPVDTSAATDYFAIAKTATASTNDLNAYGGQAPVKIFADNAYV